MTVAFVRPAKYSRPHYRRKTEKVAAQAQGMATRMKAETASVKTAGAGN
jgi:hypothetical protein